MQTYTYLATDAEGERITRSIDAPNVPAAVKAVRGEGLELVHLEELRGEFAPGRLRGIAEADLLLFYRQLATMVRTDTPLVEALRMLASETRSPRLAEAVAGVAAEIEMGSPLSHAMSLHPNVFPPTYVSLIRAAEAGADLAETLYGIADHMEHISSLARRVSIVVVYPLAVLFIAGGIVSFLTTFILPKFAELFKDLGVTEFPLPTRLLLAAGDVLPFVIPALIVVAIAIWALFYVGRRLNPRRYWTDRRKLLIPLIGPLFRYAALSRCCSGMSVLLSHGLGILQSLRLAAASAGNEAVATGLRRCGTTVAEGSGLAEGLRDAGVFPSFMVSRVAVAEKGGNLPGAFLELGRYYDQLLDLRSRIFATMIEPLLLVFVGGCVAAVIISLFLPLLAVISQLSS